MQRFDNIKLLLIVFSSDSLMKNIYKIISSAILSAFTVLALSSCQGEIVPVVTASPSPNISGSANLPFSTTTLKGKIVLPYDFKFADNTYRIKANDFTVEVYNYNGQFYGRVSNNEYGEYKFSGMPVGVRLIVKATYSKGNNLVLMSIIDIPSSQTGKETQLDISTKNTAIALIANQSQGSSINKMPVPNFENVAEIYTAVIKVENQILSVLAKPVTQMLSSLLSDSNVLNEVSNAQKIINSILAQKPDLAKPLTDINFSNTPVSTPIPAQSSSPGTTGPTPSVIITPTPQINQSTVPGTIVSRSISNLILFPSTDFTCALDAIIQFSVLGYTSSGETVSLTPIWKSSNPYIGVINNYGIFQPLTPGSTRISATLGELTAYSDITVGSSNLSSFTISPSAPPSLGIGNTIQFYTSGKDASNNNVTVTPIWTMDNNEIGAFDNQGKFTTTRAGSSKITAIVGTKTQEFTINVENKSDLTNYSGYYYGSISSLSISPTFANIPTGRTIRFYAYGKDDNGNNANIPVTWIVGDTNIGSVDTQGVFTAKNSGTTTVSATSGDKTQNVTVTVNNEYYSNYTGTSLSSITLSPAYTTLRIGNTLQFYAYGKDVGGNNVDVLPDWQVGDSSVGTIDSNGVFKATNSGSTIVMAIVGNVTQISNISVMDNWNNSYTGSGTNIARVDINPADLTIAPDQEVQFYAYGKDSNGNNVNVSPKWLLGDTSIGTIDSNGLFKSSGNGSSIVMAIVNNITYTTPITVTGASSPLLTSFDPVAGGTDTVVNIYGNYFDSAMDKNSVYFNGVKARLIYCSNTRITAIVPSGATSGYITVVTPSGTVKSSSKFTI